MGGLTATDILGQENMNDKLMPSETEAAMKVDEFLSQWDKNDLPGGAVGVVKDGKLVYKRGFDTRDALFLWYLDVGGCQVDISIIQSFDEAAARVRIQCVSRKISIIRNFVLEISV